MPIPQTADFKRKTFASCSGSFCRHVQEHEIENALSMAENADDWLRALKDLYEERTVEEPFALLTIFVPEKKKRLAKGKIIAIVVAIVVLLAGVFFGLGAARRGNQPRPPIPGQQVGQPGVPPTEPPGPPEGEAGGIKPTQPPAPTEPPVTESTEETADS